MAHLVEPLPKSKPAPLPDRAAKVMASLAALADELQEQDPAAFALIEEWMSEINPPTWVLDEDIWAQAKEAVDPEGTGAGYLAPWAVVVAVYKKMGGGVA